MLCLTGMNLTSPVTLEKNDCRLTFFAVFLVAQFSRTCEHFYVVKQMPRSQHVGFSQYRYQ